MRSGYFGSPDTGGQIMPISTCLKYQPGMVISLERHTTMPSAHQIGTPSSGTFNPTSLAIPGKMIFSPKGQLALRAYFVPPGSEMQLMTELAGLPNVLATSLNFRGRLQTQQPNDGDTTAFTAVGNQLLMRYVTVNQQGEVDDSQAVEALAPNGVIQSPNIATPIDDGHKIVVVIDLKMDHCQKMIDSVISGFKREQEQGKQGLTVLAYYRAQSHQTEVDLWSSCCLSLAMCDLAVPVAAVNYSIDLGEFCNADASPAPHGMMVYSFPLFETLLNEIDSAFHQRKQALPMLFAAAGNKSPDVDHPRWRMAYPAVLPQVVAVTQLLANPDRLAQDLPAVGSLKPCFAEQQMDENRDGTSYACAILAGRWAALEHLVPDFKNCGRFEKLAHLMRWSTLTHLGPNGPMGSPERRELPNAPWVDFPIRRLQSSLARHHDQKLDSDFYRVQRLLQHLNQKYPTREFLFTGSGAFLHWCMSSTPLPPGTKGYHHTDFLEEFDQKMIDDLDFVYSGPQLSQIEHSTVRETILVGLQMASNMGNTGISWLEKIVLQPLERWTGGIQSLQCVIPAASVFITASGPIATWHDPKTSRTLYLDFYTPPEEVWEWNPQFRVGSAGLGLGTLVWIKQLLLAFVVHRFRYHLHPTFPTGLASLERYISNPLLQDLLTRSSYPRIPISAEPTIEVVPALSLFTYKNRRLLFGQSGQTVQSRAEDRFYAKLVAITQCYRHQDPEPGSSLDSLPHLLGWLNKAWAENQSDQQKIVQTKK
jgi:hypothetical protein